jgi:hypothetical protein
MATVSIKFSQNVIDQWQVLGQQGHGLAQSVQTLIASLQTASDYVDANVSNAVWNRVGADIVVNYPDGTTETYRNVVQDNPAATSGHASVGGYDFHRNGVATVSASGQFNFDYALAGSTLNFAPSAQGSLFQHLQLATELPSSSAQYDPVFGNSSIEVGGALRAGADGAYSGTLTNASVHFDKFLSSISMQGSFSLDSAASGGLGGTLTTYQENYFDGSTATVSGASVPLNASQNIGQALLYGSAYYGGDDNISVVLPGRLVQAITIDAGAGAVYLQGGGGQLGVAAGTGNDRITLLDNGHAVDGGSGLDTVVLTDTRTQVTIHHGAAGQPAYTVTDADGKVDQLTNVERLVFADGGAYALDIDGNAGTAYRIYQAAFNRTPDTTGLGFWINALDHGQTATSMAQGFVNSAEFQQAYGTAPANLDLVTKFYQNILHRAPDSGGLNFWVDALNGHAASVPDVLAAISESAENKAALVGVIGDGFAYTPYGQA